MTTRQNRSDVDPVLVINDLRVALAAMPGARSLVEGVSLSVAPGETVALIGESGSGKTLTALSVLGLLPVGLDIPSGSITFDGHELNRMSERKLRSLRGSGVAAVFQDPMSSLDPTMKVGDQIAEPRRLHLNESRSEAREAAIELLAQVGIPDPHLRVDQFPHEFSGGMQQRVMIAAAIACRPKLLIADEPTTALDVTVQAEILDLLASLQAEMGMAVLLVTHDLGVVGHVADRVAVMHAGHLVESGATADVLDNPQHPYTAALLAALPDPDHRRQRLPVIAGRVPSPNAFPPGCRFADRCPHRLDKCSEEPLGEYTVAPGHRTRCVRIGDGSLPGVRP